MQDLKLTSPPSYDISSFRMAIRYCSYWISLSLKLNAQMPVTINSLTKISSYLLFTSYIHSEYYPNSTGYYTLSIRLMFSQ